MSWLQPRKGGLHFILNDNGNYDFDVKVVHCGFVGFVNDVIDCGCLIYVVCFRISRKAKGLVTELAPPNVQSAWGLRGKGFELRS